MNELTINDAIARSQKIRELYHELELQYHGSEWTVQEDTLAFGIWRVATGIITSRDDRTVRLELF